MYAPLLPSGLFSPLEYPMAAGKKPIKTASKDEERECSA
jgi:hypothetical protein